MGRKSKISHEIKIQIVEDYLAGKISLQSTATKLGVNRTVVDGWIRKYKAFGREGLINKGYNSSYSSEIKIQAVIDYLNGKE